MSDDDIPVTFDKKYNYTMLFVIILVVLVVMAFIMSGMFGLSFTNVSGSVSFNNGGY